MQRSIQRSRRFARPLGMTSQRLRGHRQRGGPSYADVPRCFLGCSRGSAVIVSTSPGLSIVPDRSGHRRTSTAKSRSQERMSEYMADRTVCENICQIECQNRLDVHTYIFGENTVWISISYHFYVVWTFGGIFMIVSLMLSLDLAQADCFKQAHQGA